MSIEVKNIVKDFGSFKALDDISLSIATGELVALLGPSGCGKTTLLRIIAGLETPGRGEVLLGGVDATGIHPKERKVGFVFQHYALFRNMTVFENVAFGLQALPRKNRPAKKEIRERVTRLLQMVQMEWSVDRYPSQLSGGQRQRVTLARALAVEPKVLLLDEPFSALDAKVRVELRRWLRKLHDDIHITSVFVTHDQEEALELADRIVVLNRGKIEQVGTPVEVYDNPANAFVYNFIGNVNVFHCRIHRGEVSVGGASISVPEYGHMENRAARGFVRPHEVNIDTTRRDNSAIEAVIRECRLIGSRIGLDLACVGIEGFIEVEIDRNLFQSLGLAKGMTVFIKLNNVRFYGLDTYDI